MYTPQQLVEKIREKLNKNSTNDNIEFDEPRIIIAINEAQNKFTEWILEKKNEDDVRLIQHLLIPDKVLKEVSKTENSHYFELPKDYFDLANILSKAKCKKCVDNILLWEVKSQNFNELLNDDNNKPSFFARESFYYLGNNKVRVFRDSSFEINSVLLTYYRYPKKIDISGYVSIDGADSQDVSPEWDDRAMDRIISIAVKDLSVNAENLGRFQIDDKQIKTKF
jgi:hypothetical protein